MNTPTRSRRTLLLVAVAFLSPFLLAVVLRFGGWQPGSTRNYGELLQPPLPMHEVSATASDGSAWVWENQEQRWTLLARVGSACDEACARTLALLPNVRTALGRHAGRLPQFMVGSAPADAPFANLQLGSVPAPLVQPLAAGVEAWLVDPHGYLVLHYPAGFDPNGLRRDLSRLIK